MWDADGYVSTYAMTLTETGATTSKAVELGQGLRLHRGDHVVAHGDDVVWFTGSGDRIELNVVAVR